MPDKTPTLAEAVRECKRALAALREARLAPDDYYSPAKLLTQQLQVEHAFRQLLLPAARALLAPSEQRIKELVGLYWAELERLQHSEQPNGSARAMRAVLRAATGGEDG